MPTQSLSKRKAPVKGKSVTVGKKCQGEVDFNSDLSYGWSCKRQGKEHQALKGERCFLITNIQPDITDL